MKTQLIGSQAIKLLSKLTGQDLTVHDITPQVVFMADLIALLKGVIHADAKVSEDEVAQFKATLGKLKLTSKQTVEVAKLLLSGVQKYKLHSEIDDFLILLVPLSEAEKLLLFGLGYRMAMADSSLDASESKYLRDLGKRLEIESRYLDVLESSFAGKSYNNQDFQEVCDLVDPARFHDLGTVFVNAADDLLTALNQIFKTEIKEPQNVPNSTDSVSDEYQKLQGFQLQKQSLLKRINHLSQLIDGGIKESLLPITFSDEIQTIKDKLESQRFRVAVIGDFSQGKSTLLNALLGEEIQPVRAIPCSGTLSVLKYGDRKRVICRYRDGNEQEIAVEDYQKKAAISKEAALNNRSEELLKSNIAEIVFEHPNLLLCRNGVEIVDSPGLNEHPDRTRVTEELLKETDAILFMTNANKLLTQGERDIITRIKEREGDRPLENLFLVVNFMDNLDTDEDREDVQIAANSIIKDGSITGKERIHFVSAKSALKATLSNTSNEYLVSFQNFTGTLEAFLTDERGSVILQSATQKLNELTQDCVNELNTATDSINTNLAASYKEEILERIGEASGRFVTIRKMVDYLRKQTTDLALVSWQENSAKFQARIEQRSKEWKTDHNPLFSRDSLIQDYVGQFSQSLQGEINSWVQFHLNNENNEIIAPKLNLLDRGIKAELTALNASFSGLDKKIGTNFDDNFSPAFNNFDASYVAAWTAGGVVGGGAGAAAAFFMIPALALGPAVIIGIAAAALLGGGGLWASMSDAYYQIGKQVCDSGFGEFKKSEDSIKEKIGEFIATLFDNRIQSVDALIKQVISECENRLELEERKQQEEGDRLRSLIVKNQVRN
ncbi:MULTISPECIES: dynamin family protein [Pseudanabaena]|uniref:Dynamin family protein n=2 Tax=Pseudanabaena TaxID=1152 RepID=L8MR41_9CYAN|nr:MULTISPECIES: dynamin family protein [Pseudanabaena]ELS30367.1 Dynamin family protein [Pseudanabaena biceps PCC 7429]MDG3497354.1 dynamin family protein [Pseudanabaena catenata USMAC16]